MSKLYVARRPQRKAVVLPMEATRNSPSLILPLHLTDRSELDELIRGELEKLGITSESEVQAIVDKAETDSELNIKVQEARKELRRLMDLRAEGASLMQVGNKKWKQVYYPARK